MKYPIIEKKGGKQNGAKVEKRFPALHQPWLFIAYSASILADEKEFSLVEAAVSYIIFLC